MGIPFGKTSSVEYDFKEGQEVCWTDDDGVEKKGIVVELPSKHDSGVKVALDGVKESYQEGERIAVNGGKGWGWRRGYYIRGSDKIKGSHFVNILHTNFVPFHSKDADVRKMIAVSPEKIRLPTVEEKNADESKQEEPVSPSTQSTATLAEALNAEEGEKRHTNSFMDPAPSDKPQLRREGGRQTAAVTDDKVNGHPENEPDEEEEESEISLEESPESEETKAPEVTDAEDETSNFIKDRSIIGSEPSQDRRLEGLEIPVARTQTPFNSILGEFLDLQNIPEDDVLAEIIPEGEKSEEVLLRRRLMDSTNAVGIGAVATCGVAILGYFAYRLHRFWTAKRRPQETDASMV